MSLTNMMIFSGSANRTLAAKVAAQLHLPLGKIRLEGFSDGELMVDVEENVRNQDIFIIQPLCSPVNDHLMELIFMTDAFRRASAQQVTAVIPYMGYARQDRRPYSARVPISAKVIANMVTAVGVSRVLTVDLHADQIQGFFDISLDNVYAMPVLLGDIWKRRNGPLAVISPDVGGVVRARALTKHLEDAQLAIIDKRRPKPNESEVMHIIGDVSGYPCVIIDDIVDTAGTLCKAAAALKQNGAKWVSAYCTHPVLSGEAITNIRGSKLDELVVTDTIPLSAEAEACGTIRQLSIANMLAESMRRICEGESLSSMFVN